MQKPYPETARFPCDPNGPGARSSIVPSSVHMVRPGDIDIVAAMGDSLTAGNGNDDLINKHTGKLFFILFLIQTSVLRSVHCRCYGYKYFTSYYRK